MGSRLVTVHAGPLWEVHLLQGQLEALGVPSFVHEDSTIPYDPFAGLNPLGTSLQVQEEYADRAMALIERNQKVAEQQDPEASSNEFPTTVDPEARLGRRIRYASLLFVTAPLALAMGVVYLWRLRPGGSRPQRHGLTLAAIVLSVPLTLALLLAVGLLLGWEWPPWLHETA